MWQGAYRIIRREFRSKSQESGAKRISPSRHCDTARVRVVAVEAIPEFKAQA